MCRCYLLEKPDDKCCTPAMQELPVAHMPDYSHLAPKLHGKERLDVAVAAVAQAASAAAAAAAAAVISAAGEQVRAIMQVSRLPL